MQSSASGRSTGPRRPSRPCEADTATKRVVRGRPDEGSGGREIVPGDIIFLEAGDQIPADARLIEAEDFRVDNSALTGESHPAYKVADPVTDGQEFLWTEMPNLVFAGTAGSPAPPREWSSPPAWTPSWATSPP